MTDPWRDLYDREYPRLVRALMAMSGDGAAAEDAAQEAFVRAHRFGLDRIERPAAWLLAVGSRDLFRRRKRRRVEDDLWQARERDAAGDNFEAAIERADLLAALRHLAERQRSIVVARYYYGLSYAEIAAAFAISGGTVGATLSQAIAKLRQLQLAGRLARGAMR